MSYFEKYYKAFNKLLWLSKLSSFLIAILVFLQIFEINQNYFRSEDFFNQYFYWNITSAIFILLISLLFTLRFVFLWFEKTKFIWLSQFLWLFGWLSIYAYKLTTAKLLFGSFWYVREIGCLDCIWHETFLFGSKWIVLFLICYLTLSPIKQLITIIYSFFIKK